MVEKTLPRQGGLAGDFRTKTMARAAWNQPLPLLPMRCELSIAQTHLQRRAVDAQEKIRWLRRMGARRKAVQMLVVRSREAMGVQEETASRSKVPMWLRR